MCHLDDDGRPALGLRMAAYWAAMTGPTGGQLCTLRRGREDVSTTTSGPLSGLSQIAPSGLRGLRVRRAVSLLRRRGVAVFSAVMSSTLAVRATTAALIPSILAVLRSRILGKRVWLHFLGVVCITD